MTVNKRARPYQVNKITIHSWFKRPCKKCDMDSHENSMSFHVTNRRQFFMEIDTKFHDYSILFIQVLLGYHAGTWHGFWTCSSHGSFMAFAKKMMGFPSDLVSFSTKLPSKRHEKKPLTFFTGIILIFNVLIYDLPLMPLFPSPPLLRNKKLRISV